MLNTIVCEPMYAHWISSRSKNLSFRFKRDEVSGPITLRGSHEEILEAIASNGDSVFDAHWFYCGQHIIRLELRGYEYSGSESVHEAMRQLKTVGGMAYFESIPCQSRSREVSGQRVSFYSSKENHAFLQSRTNKSRVINQALDQYRESSKQGEGNA